MVYVGDMAGRTGLGPADVVFGAAVVVKVGFRGAVWCRVSRRRAQVYISAFFLCERTSLVWFSKKIPSGSSKQQTV